MNERDFNASVLVPNLAVLLFVAIGLLSTKAPLVSHRPDGSTVDAPAVSESPARLWEDPLGVKPPAASAAAGLPLLRSLAEASLQKKKALTERADPLLRRGLRVLLMPVFVSGKTYPEDIEQRLRTRYAVIAALGRAQYVSLRPEQMQFVFDEKGTAVPYEEFEVRRLVADGVEMPDNENYWPPRWMFKVWEDTQSERLKIPVSYDRIVVLWLDEDRFFKPAPAGSASTAAIVSDRLDRLLARLLGPESLSWRPVVPAPETPSANDSITWALKIIGPTNSDNLVNLLETNEAGTPPPPGFVDLFSPRATAPDEALQISSSHVQGFGQFPLQGIFRPTPPWTLHRTIATDYQLAKVALTELKRRNAAPNAKNHLVLVGEWDSLYSRAVARSFAEIMNADALPQSVKDDPDFHPRARHALWATNPPNLHEFSYLRGLDGRLSGTPGAATRPPARDNDENKSRRDKSSTATVNEAAEGRSQFDYLRRLERSVRELQEDLARKQQKIGAIGVVGSDTYDKLLVLRALRSSFPGAAFFTTDFDATFMDRTEDAWTTNLLIFSSFGPTAAKALQNRIPPFRDGYQTALFLSVLKAVGVEQIGHREFRLTPDSILPRIFELGRTGYIDLSESEPCEHAALQPAPPPHSVRLGWLVLVLVALGIWFWLQSSREDFQKCLVASLWLMSLFGLTLFAADHLRETMRLLGSLGALAIGVALVFPFYFLLRSRRTSDPANPPASQPKNLGSLVAAGLASVGAAWAIVHTLYLAQSWTEEPFAWFEGLSIWPAEILRVVAALFATLSIVLVQSRLEKLQSTLTRQYFPTLPSPTGNSSSNATALQLLKSSVLALSNQIRSGGWWLRAPANEVRPAGPPRFVPRQRERAFWSRYLRLASPVQRFPRVLACVFAYLLFFRVLRDLTTSPIVPVRGEWSQLLDRAAAQGEAVIYCFLLFFVFDVTLLAANLIAKLVPYIAEDTELNQNNAIHLINELVEAIAGLVYLPFTVLLMMIVARNSLFDAYDWPPFVIGFFASGLVLILFTTVLLQQRAREAKAAALDYFDQETLTLLTKKQTAARCARPGKPFSTVSYDTRERLLRDNRAQVAAYNSVAFQAWHHNPIFRAILIPLGGLGSLQLLEKFSTVFGS